MPRPSKGSASSPAPAPETQAHTALGPAFAGIRVDKEMSVEMFLGIFDPLDGVCYEQIPEKFMMYDVGRPADVDIGELASMKPFLLEDCPKTLLEEIADYLKEKTVGDMKYILSKIINKIIIDEQPKEMDMKDKKNNKGKDKKRLNLSSRALLEFFVLADPLRTQVILNNIIDPLYISERIFKNFNETDIRILNEFVRISFQGVFRKTSTKLITMILRDEHDETINSYIQKAIEILGALLGKEMPKYPRENMSIFTALMDIFVDRRILSANGKMVALLADKICDNAPPFWELRFQIASALFYLPQGKEKLKGLNEKGYEDNLVYVLLSNEKVFLKFLLFNDPKIKYSKEFRKVLCQIYPKYKTIIKEKVAIRDRDYLMISLVLILKVLTFIILTLHLFIGANVISVYMDTKK